MLVRSSYTNGTLMVNAATPIAINAPVQLLDGNFQLTFIGVDAGVSNQIQAGTDFGNPMWSILATDVATITGLPNFTDTDATNYAIRFHLAVVP